MHQYLHASHVFPQTSLPSLLDYLPQTAYYVEQQWHFRLYLQPRVKHFSVEDKYLSAFIDYELNQYK